MCSRHVEAWNKTYCKTKILCIELVNYWDKYTLFLLPSNALIQKQQHSWMFVGNMKHCEYSDNRVETTTVATHTICPSKDRNWTVSISDTHEQQHHTYNGQNYSILPGIIANYFIFNFMSLTS